VTALLRTGRHGGIGTLEESVEASQVLVESSEVKQGPLVGTREVEFRHFHLEGRGTIGRNTGEVGSRWCGATGMVVIERTLESYPCVPEVR